MPMDEPDHEHNFTKCEWRQVYMRDPFDMSPSYVFWS